MNSTKEIEVPIGEQIKSALAAESRKDGLKRTQRWLANLINMSEVELSNKIANANGKTMLPEDLTKINEVLGTNFTAE